MEVVSTRMPEAEQLLSDVSCVELSNQRASELVGRIVTQDSGRALFLVRALYLNRTTGKFGVSVSDHELFVGHNSMGHTAVPMKRQALVVRLTEKPDVVYVSCSMDE